MKGNFQIILIVVFLVAAVFGVLVFSGAIPLGDKANQAGGLGTVILWGTTPASVMAPLIDSFNGVNPSFVVRYVQKFSDTFDKDLLKALAAGAGPDLFFIPSDLAFSYNDKIFTIPYTSFPLASFKNNFAGAGEVFLTQKGILALPLAIDPLVMYYNRSMLDSNGFVYPPKYWDELVDFVPKLTQKDDSGKIIKSAFALGQFANILHAKDILTTLFMQTGNPIIIAQDGSFYSALNNSTGKYNLGSVLQFYTNFADSLKDVYSWNRSLPNSQDAFSAENLAFYFGFTSELKSLVDKNPNQNFLVAPMPQIKNANFKLTSARVIGLAISSFSKNFNTAFLAANLMATGDFTFQFIKALNVAPARLNLLKEVPANVFSPTFYASALYARSWLDPSPTDTDQIFRGMVEKVLSNEMSANGAVGDADSKLRLLLIK